MDASVKILLSEVKYETRFDSWTRSRVRNGEQRNADGKSYRAVEYGLQDEGTEDWLVRQVQDAVDMLYGQLRWCLHDDSRMQSDEILENPTEWALHFRLPDTWGGSVRALKGHIHRFISDYVTAQWDRATGDERGQQNYAGSAEAHLERAYQEARSDRVSLEPWRL